MSKPVKRAKAEASLLAKGFVKDNRDHDYFYFWHNGIRTKAWTMLSRWKRGDDIDPCIFKMMKRQLQLRYDKEVEDLLSCNMDMASYIAKLQEYGVFQN